MKTLLTSLALAAIAFTTPNLHADSIGASVNAGAGAITLVNTPVFGVDTFSFSYTSTEDSTVFGHGHTPVVDTTTNLITATYIDPTGTHGILTVTDVCAQIGLGTAYAACQPIAFSFTDLTLSDPSLVFAFNTGTSISGDVATVDFSGQPGIESATFDFTKGPSPVPEPGSLSLMATGLFAAAGFVRRKFLA